MILNKIQIVQQPEDIITKDEGYKARTQFQNWPVIEIQACETFRSRVINSEASAIHQDEKVGN